MDIESVVIRGIKSNVPQIIRVLTVDEAKDPLI